MIDGQTQHGAIEKAQFLETDSALHIKERQGIDAIVLPCFVDDGRRVRRGAYGENGGNIGCKGMDFAEVHDGAGTEPSAVNNGIVGRQRSCRCLTQRNGRAGKSLGNPVCVLLGESCLGLINNDSVHGVSCGGIFKRCFLWPVKASILLLRILADCQQRAGKKAVKSM